jgi:branched-chain amino acid transport system substrate-binding protein
VREELAKGHAFVVESDYAYGKSMAEEFSKTFEELGGQIVRRAKIFIGQRDFGELFDNPPEPFDLLFYGGAFEGAYVLRAMRQLGHNQLFSAGDGCWDLTNFLIPAGEATRVGEGALVLSATPSSDHQKAFTSDYEARYGPITNYAVNSYDATRVLLAAVKAVAQGGSIVNRQNVAAALGDISFAGIAYEQPVHWDDKGDNLAAVTALYRAGADRFQQVAVR